ncbi:MAG TPA: Rne/Rng family ribonuclease [Mycobacteriales bacterium]|nr:Rne/Rng family ribonuclease [Mycobacteriales bacterium]
MDSATAPEQARTETVASGTDRDSGRDSDHDSDHDDTDSERRPSADADGYASSASSDSSDNSDGTSRRRRRGRRGRGRTGQPDGDESGTDQNDEHAADTDTDDAGDQGDSEGDGTSRRRRRRRRRSGSSDDAGDNGPTGEVEDEVQGVKGSTRLEAKRQRRRDGRDQGRRRPPILSEAEFLARREAVDRTMVVRQHGERTQIAVLEDDVLVEHYVTKATSTSYAGNVYLGRVQNVLPSMEAAFIDIGKGRNAVLYAGEVNWEEAGLGGKARSIEQAMRSGDSVLVQVSKDPIGHKGARLTSQISLPGRYLVYVPGGSMTGISRKLPDTERSRLKSILRKIVPEDAGVIIRTAAEGASEEELTHDVNRLKAQWEALSDRAEKEKSSAPVLLHAEPDLAIRVVRDIFNEDFASLVVSGDEAWETVGQYVDHVAPDLRERLRRHTGESDVFHDLRIDEQLAKALDRKVWLPSGGSLVIDRTEAMTVIDVNTGRYTGQGGNLEETVTRNNLEAAEEIVRQLRLRDVGGIIVIDFIDMVLESNRDLVLRRLTECLGRDRTRHQVAEVTSLGLVQMTRKRVGQGLLEAFSEPCEHCQGRGVIVHTEPVDVGGKSRREPKRAEKSKGKSGKKNDTENGSGENEVAPSAASTAIHAVAAAAAGRSQNGSGDKDAADVQPESPAAEVHEAAPANDAVSVAEPARVAEPAPAAEAGPAAEAADTAPEPVAAPAASARPRRGRRRAAVREAGPPEHAAVGEV